MILHVYMIDYILVNFDYIKAQDVHRQTAHEITNEYVKPIIMKSLFTLGSYYL
jgi:hypothetical protein